MKAFLKRTTIFISLLILILFTMSRFLYNHQGFMGVSKEKQSWLETAPHPRIVFVGGSSVAYGIGSEIIKKELPQLNPVNMGLYGGLGLFFMIKEATFFSQKGDTIIIAPEYDHFTSLFYGQNTSAIIKNLMVTPGNIRFFLHYKQLKNVLDSFLSHYIHQDIRPIPKRKYRRHYTKFPPGFNDFGDITSHLGQKGKEHLEDIILKINKTYLQEVISHLSKVINKMNIENKKVFFVFPPFCHKNFYKKENEEFFKTLYQEIQQIPHLKVLTSPQEDTYPDKYFFDTCYHLNTEGRKIHTEKIIKRLKELL